MVEFRGNPDYARIEIEEVLEKICRRHDVSLALNRYDNPHYEIWWYNPWKVHCLIVVENSPTGMGGFRIRAASFPPSYRIAHLAFSHTFGMSLIGDPEAAERMLEEAWQWNNEQRDPFPDTSALTTEFFVDRLRDPDEEVRASAANALRDRRDTESVLPLIEALPDRVPMVRSCIASALGAIGDKRAIPALQSLLRTPDDGPSFTARRALGQIREKSHQHR